MNAVHHVTQPETQRVVSIKVGEAESGLTPPTGHMVLQPGIQKYVRNVTPTYRSRHKKKPLLCS